MELKYFSLGTIENSRLVKIFRIIFGFVCITIAIFWMIFNIRSLKADGTLWITIFFLSGFGFYQIWSGMGRAARFIEIGQEKLRIKKNSLLQPVEMSVREIEKIELFPLNIIIFLKSKKRFLLRFGTTYHDVNEKIKEEIFDFAESNKIPLEIIREEL
jgi:hypothetical protein